MVPGSLDARKYQWLDMDWPVRPKASLENTRIQGGRSGAKLLHACSRTAAVRRPPDLLPSCRRLPTCHFPLPTLFDLQLPKERFHIVSGSSGGLNQFASGLSFHLAPGHTPGQVRRKRQSLRDGQLQDCQGSAAMRVGDARDNMLLLAQLRATKHMLQLSR